MLDVPVPEEDNLDACSAETLRDFVHITLRRCNFWFNHLRICNRGTLSLIFSLTARLKFYQLTILEVSLDIKTYPRVVPRDHLSFCASPFWNALLLHEEIWSTQVINPLKQDGLEIDTQITKFGVLKRHIFRSAFFQLVTFLIKVNELTIENDVQETTMICHVSQVRFLVFIVACIQRVRQISQWTKM